VKPRMNRNAKRSALAVFASGMAVVASLGILPASAALAATEKCTTHTLSTVKFTLCTQRVSSVRGRAIITVNSGTFVSGTLYLEEGDNADAGCSGKHSPGYTCSFSETDGSGVYDTVWYSASGGTYNSGGLLVN
jgi:hypothetical protein